MLAYWCSAFKKLVDTKCCSFGLNFKGYFLKAISVVKRIRKSDVLRICVFLNAHLSQRFIKSKKEIHVISNKPQCCWHFLLWLYALLFIFTIWALICILRHWFHQFHSWWAQLCVSNRTTMLHKILIRSELKHALWGPTLTEVSR